MRSPSGYLSGFQLSFGNKKRDSGMDQSTARRKFKYLKIRNFEILN
jgi:hypothetical protein